MRFSLVLLLSVFCHGSQGSEEILSVSTSKKTILTQDPRRRLQDNNYLCTLAQQARNQTNSIAADIAFQVLQPLEEPLDACFDFQLKMPIFRGVVSKLMKEFSIRTPDLTFDFFKQLSDAHGKMNGKTSKKVNLSQALRGQLQDSPYDFIFDLSISCKFTYAAGELLLGSILEVSALVELPIAALIAVACKNPQLQMPIFRGVVSKLMKKLSIRPSDLTFDFFKQLSDAHGKMNGNQSKNNIADHKKSPHVEG